MAHIRSHPAAFGAYADRAPPFAGSWRGAAARRWHPLELTAMIIGFAIFWPVGLAVLAWKKWTGAPRAPFHMRRDSLMADTGNTAFEAFKQAELARLEEERRRLAEAQAAFGDFLDRLKRARDREEFERFMAERLSAAHASAGRGAAPGQPAA